MVLDAAGVAHAAAGDDDGRAGIFVDLHRFLDRGREAQVLEREGVEAVLDDFHGFVVVVLAVVTEDLGGLDGQRAIQEDRDVGQLAFALELAQHIEQLLGALDREGRNHNLFAVTRGIVDGLEQLDLAGLERAVQTVAIGRFDENHVGLFDRGRVLHNQLVVAADVARKDQLDLAFVVRDPQLQDAGTQDVAGVFEACLHAGTDVEAVVGLLGVQVVDAFLSVFGGVERHHLLVLLTAVLAVLPFGFDFLDVGRIEQHDLAQVGGWRRGDDRAAETILDQLGQSAGVVEVGVGQQHGFDFAGIEVPGQPVAGLHLSAALEEAAVDQDLFAAGGFDQVIGAGHAAGGSQAGYFYHGCSFGVA
ncbi:MAG: hypothetical protein BWY87_00070 [Deltaproteobacteria bacterium ADurb.Bin510]|nr:MAG: hypothetical protein BWY87_00070 [Deltaproteobacteria bacterium ADurb.Bin510]